jgi:hypothetical protein
MSVYIEHCGGNFPAWIAPVQAIVLTVSDKTEEYGRDVLARPLACPAARRRTALSAPGASVLLARLCVPPARHFARTLVGDLQEEMSMSTHEGENVGPAKEADNEGGELTEEQLEAVSGGQGKVPTTTAGYKTGDGRAKNRRVEVEVVGTRSK